MAGARGGRGEVRAVSAVGAVSAVRAMRVRRPREEPWGRAVYAARAHDGDLVPSQHALRAGAGPRCSIPAAAPQVLGNCRNTTVHRGVNSKPIPHVHWTDFELRVKAKLPKLILYAYADDAPGGRYYAWPGIQPHLRQECTLAKLNCTLEYVPFEGPWNEDVLTDYTVRCTPTHARSRVGLPERTRPRWKGKSSRSRGRRPVAASQRHLPASTQANGNPSAKTKYKTPADITIWGPWLYVAAPMGFRRAVENWVTSAPL